MRSLLEVSFTVKQLLLLILFMGFSITPWGLLITQHQPFVTKVATSTPAPMFVPIAASNYPTLPPMTELNKAFVLDNHAISRLKALVNQSKDASVNSGKITGFNTPNTIDKITQRCWLDGQSYVAGDIVKTPSGWVRCYPIQVSSLDKNKGESLGWLPV